MTTPDLHAPFPATPPHTGLTRSRQRRLIGGVIAGLHRHFRVPLNLNLFRALTVIFSVMTVFPGLLAYLLLWVLVPQED